MNIVFQTNLTPSNMLEEVEKFLNKLNELAKVEIFFLNGTTIGFNDGGKLEKFQKTTGGRFAKLDLKESVSDGPEIITFIAGNVARYGLISHNLYDKIKVGPGKENENTGLIIGA